MVRERILVDTGPLVAILAKEDAAHAPCVEKSHELAKPFLTTWPILTEAAWLLRGEQDAIPKLLGLLEQQLIRIIDLNAAAGPTIAALARTYADIRPDFADLTLIYAADQEGLNTIFSLDQRDFAIYRDKQGRPFQIVP